jgi:hypothetical protein
MVFTTLPMRRNSPRSGPVVAFEVHGLAEVAARHGADHAAISAVGWTVSRSGCSPRPRCPPRSRRRPAGGRAGRSCPACRPPRRGAEFAGHAVVELDHLVEGVGDLPPTPSRSFGRRTEKSPRRKARRPPGSGGRRGCGGPCVGAPVRAALPWCGVGGGGSRGVEGGVGGHEVLGSGARFAAGVSRRAREILSHCSAARGERQNGSREAIVGRQGSGAAAGPHGSPAQRIDR